jgi:hypothetical protein
MIVQTNLRVHETSPGPSLGHLPAAVVRGAGPETTAVLVLGRTTGTLDRLEGRRFRTVADAVARFESTSGPGERGSPGRASPGR